MPGREYMIRRLEAVGNSAWATEWAEYPFWVCDGAWVLEVSSGYTSQTYYHDKGDAFWLEVETSERKFEVVGEAKRIILERSHRSRADAYGSFRSGSSDVLLVSPEPFGAISWSEEDGEHLGGKYFRPARQIHKGELGRIPQIETPRFAREAPSKVTEWTGKRDRKRGYIGWARLTEVARLANLKPHQVILDYWDFVTANEFGSTELDMVIAFSREQIHKRIVSRELRFRFTRQQVTDMAVDPSIQWQDFWIRRGFARTVLMLQHFGWHPKPADRRVAS